MREFFKRMKLRFLQKKAKKLHQIREQGQGAGFEREIEALLELATFFDKNRFYKKFPEAETFALEYYRAAASLDDPRAQYTVSQYLFDKARLYDNWRHDIYGSSIHERYASFYYEDAFKYLKESEAGGYALARRFHGLAYIHGWGVVKDTEKGFQMIIASIDMEQAWDRSTKILEELKLNSPEFFNSIIRYKAKNSEG